MSDARLVSYDPPAHGHDKKRTTRPVNVEEWPLFFHPRKAAVDVKIGINTNLNFCSLNPSEFITFASTSHLPVLGRQGTSWIQQAKDWMIVSR